MGPVGLWCTVLDVWLCGEQRSLPPSQKPVEAWQSKARRAKTTLNDQQRMPCRCARTMAAAQSPRPRPARPRREPRTVLVPSSSRLPVPGKLRCQLSCTASLARAGFLTSVVCQPILRYHPNLRCPRHPRHPAGLLLYRPRPHPRDRSLEPRIIAH
eukprot:scaffold125111_cov54-Phaeocystis_antarctica.AAC.1